MDPALLAEIDEAITWVESEYGFVTDVLRKARRAIEAEVWQPPETAPEWPTRPYLALDHLGYAHLTRHPRSTLMHAGWGKAWKPIRTEDIPEDQLSIQQGGMAIAAGHAREFKRLLKGHAMPADTVIEGVMLAPEKTA
jgi:hypothetical protein